MKTVQEAAVALAVSPKVIYGLVKRGELDAIKVGRGWRIEDSAIKAFKVRARVQPATVPGRASPRPRQRKGEVRHLRALHKAVGDA